MSKDAYYFSHDANAQDDEKILDLRADYGWEGYGLYWAVIELMRNQTDYMLENNGRLYKKLSMKFNVDADYMKKFIEDCINYGLFIKDNGNIYSESFLKRMEKYEQRKEAARKAANARWHNDSNANEDTEEKQEECDRIANALREHNDSNASKVNKSKVNKSKLKEKEYKYAMAVADIFNKWKDLLADINDARLTKKTIKLILTKLKKWNAEDIIKAIEHYNEIYRSEFYYNHNFTLQKFIKQGNGAPRFMPGLDQEEDGNIWKDYKKENVEELDDGVTVV